MREVALHKGAPLDSVRLTLLFGFLHWKPMADAARGSLRAIRPP